MADNVNIIVQDTINDIVVNAAVVVETIDINVQAAVDVVDIVANPNNYVVNINRIIGEQVQSDWTQTDNQAPDYIKNKPTIPAAQVNSDWNATTGVAEILNKPTIPAAVTKTSDLINDGEDGVDPFITAADIPPVTGFVPYTGATQNVDLGEFEIKAGQVTLDTSPTGTAAVATTRWNDSIGSTETTLKGGSVVLKNGVDLVARVVNKVTPNATLTKAAYQAVRVSGAQGQRLAVAYAQANSDNNSADTIGIVCETIATNQEGFILTVGQLDEINTSGSLQGETWVDGDVLYLSPTIAGRLTNIKPTGATGHIVVMGYVEYAHAIHGSIYVKIMNGWELDELHNVYITSPANNEGLFYNSADSLWKNKTIAAALGYTPVTNARTISTTAPLSGGGDLTANRTLSISQASTSTDGYLSSTNWNTFNNKQEALGFTPENVINKQNSLALDGTGVKYSTVDSVNNLSFIDKFKRGIQYFTDFDNIATSTPNFTQFQSGAGATVIRSVVAIPNQTSNQIGFCQYQTGTTTTGYATHITEGQVGRQFVFGGGSWVFETFVNVETLSTATERFRFVTGFGDQPTNASDGNAAIFTYDEGGTQNGTIASANWQCVTSVSSVRTLTTTSTAVSANTWTKLRIEVNAAGTSVTFYINGTLVATHTTNIPTFISFSNNRGFNVKQSILKSIGTTNRSVFCDYLGYENRLTTIR